MPLNKPPLSEALRHLEIAEANLVKLESLWIDISSMMPEGPAFGAPEEYEDKCRSYEAFLPFLTKIDGWRPTATPLEFDAIGQARLSLLEFGSGDLYETVALDKELGIPGAEIRQYRFLLNQKRRQIIRREILRLITCIDQIIEKMGRELIDIDENSLLKEVSKSIWTDLDEYIGQLDLLLGSIERPKRWSDLMRHKNFADKKHAAARIRNIDWPEIKKGLNHLIYNGDPIPTEIEDIGELLTGDLSGQISRELNWSKLSPEGFERLIFILISSTDGYENPQWLMQTKAPDRGRDLSVDRIIKDNLGGVSRKRVIIQCKHWTSKSVSLSDISDISAQMTLWAPPRVDICIIATSGRFTADAVAFVEKYNQSDSALMIEMWPETHLETILARRPDLIADFKIRDI